MSGTIQAPSSILTQFPTTPPVSSVTTTNVENFIATAFGMFQTTQTVSYQPVITDAGTTILMNSATPVNLTIASGVFSIHQAFAVRQIGAGQVTFVASSTTLLSSSGTLTTRAQYSLVVLTQSPTLNTWYLDGDLT